MRKERVDEYKVEKAVKSRRSVGDPIGSAELEVARLELELVS